MPVRDLDSSILLAPIMEFLPCATPDAWFDSALENQSVLLIDHANCEKKAASTAMSLMYRHTERSELMLKMSQLAREELLHFQQVVEILAARSIPYVRLSPSRYAGRLRGLIGANEGEQLTDTLLVGAFIEARSCERFAGLAPRLDPPLRRFYKSLLKSEARHFQDYLALARLYDDSCLQQRLQGIAEVEAELVLAPDDEFRFHSGPPRQES